MATDSGQSVIELLVAQHMEIKKLFVDVATAEGRRRQELFEDLVRLLAVHESAEEEVVHPTARRNIDGGSDIVDRRLEEENAAKRALAELYDLGVDHPEFESRLDSLAEEVIRHATAEETEEFARLQKTLQHHELVRMAGVVRAAEAVAPTRPHPMAGEAATANVLVGPPLAVFDRVRDAARKWGQS